MTSHAVRNHIEAKGILNGKRVLVSFPLKAYVRHS